jgi:quercetin dioxygenase-like cupin family protein
MAYIDPVEVSPDNYKVLLENDQVCVLEMTLKAGESDVMHSHPNETVYFEAGGSVVVHLPDGSTSEMEPPDGLVVAFDAWTHRVQNVGTTDIRAIIFEPK